MPVSRLVATPPPGTFVDVVTVSLAALDVGVPVTVLCTTDGSVPVSGVTSPCPEPLVIDRSTGVRAIAVDDAGVTRGEFFGVWLALDADVVGFASNLPLVVLWSTEPAPEFKTEFFTPFTVAVFDAGVGDNVWPGAAALSSRAGIKIRGSSTAGYPKHPWRLETRRVRDDGDDAVSLLGMPPESDWVLNAPLDFDRALQRNSLAFALSNAAGRYAPRTRHAELFVVGDGGAVGMDDYEGIYEVAELIKRDAHRVAIARLDPDDVDPVGITGGYLWKVDRTGPGEVGFFAGSGGGAFDFQQPFVFDDPSESEIVDVQRAYLAGVLDDIARALLAPDLVDPRTGLRYDQLLDVPSTIDHHILNVFTKNPDAFRLSGYFHKDRGGPVQSGPVWDFDRTMGCAADSRADDPTGWDATDVTFDTTDVFRFGYFPALFADPAFAAAYWARLRVLLDGPLSVENVHAIIDGYSATLATAAPRNFARWSDYPPRGSFDDEVALLKAWIARRHAWMSGCLDLPDPRVCPR